MNGLFMNLPNRRNDQITIYSGVFAIVMCLGLSSPYTYGQSKAGGFIAGFIVCTASSLGAYAAFANRRVYLYVLALIYLILIALMLSVAASDAWIIIGLMLVVMLLVILQSELLRRGHNNQASSAQPLTVITQ